MLTRQKLVEFLKECEAGRKECRRIWRSGQGKYAAELLRRYRRILLSTRSTEVPHKQGRFLPGTHIPIYEPERISVTKPDYILILPWNLKDEIINQLSFARDWGAQFVVPIPEPQIVQ